MHLLSERSLKRLHSLWFQLYDILKKADYADSKKISGYQGLRGRRNGLGEHRGFGGREPILCDITMASVHHQIFVKPRGL